MPRTKNSHPHHNVEMCLPGDWTWADLYTRLLDAADNQDWNKVLLVLDDIEWKQGGQRRCDKLFEKRDTRKLLQLTMLGPNPVRLRIICLVAEYIKREYGGLDRVLSAYFLAIEGCCDSTDRSGDLEVMRLFEELLQVDVNAMPRFALADTPAVHALMSEAPAHIFYYLVHHPKFIIARNMRALSISATVPSATAAETRILLEHMYNGDNAPAAYTGADPHEELIDYAMELGLGKCRRTSSNLAAMSLLHSYGALIRPAPGYTLGDYAAYIGHTMGLVAGTKQAVFAQMNTGPIFAACTETDTTFAQ